MYDEDSAGGYCVYHY